MAQAAGQALFWMVSMSALACSACDKASSPPVAGAEPGLTSGASASAAPASGPSGPLPAAIVPAPRPEIRWRRVRHETFDAPFAEPQAWTEDVYGDASPWNVDVFDDDGAYFRDAGGPAFDEELASFRSFRKSFSYGQDGWLTVELYGRDEDKDGVPESGGHFTSESGQAVLRSARHTDAGILRTTAPLPSRYRLRVTVSGVEFGGAQDGSFSYGGKINGYDGGESAGPWRLSAGNKKAPPATTDNGVYFLCIVDYPRAAPHNNVFIHHHRKVVLDTDNNSWQGRSWSKILRPGAKVPEEDGSMWAGLVFLRGDDFGNDRVGNGFVSWTAAGFVEDPVFADKYLPGERYVFTIERDGLGYTLSIEGRFAYGGEQKYEARRAFEGSPPIWHYNQTAEEGPQGRHNQRRKVGGKEIETWPAGAGYPDVMLLGDPHINYYEGAARYDDLELWVPEGP
ncbi:MAG: hypothetical protein R3F14_46330 [Polyangiaceae bacterium]